MKLSLMGVVRGFSYAFHLVVGLFCVALGFVAWASDLHNLRIGVLPWTGSALTYWLVAMGVAALVVTVMAVRGVWAILYALWAAGTAGTLLYGFLIARYSFQSLNEWYQALWFMGASLVALIGAISCFRLQARKR